MKKNLLILADDLTGALDTGVQFAMQGIETRVYPSIEAVPKPETGINDKGATDIPAIVINTNTRHADSEQARSIVKTAATAFENISFIYKKTDSCLRGNIGAELQALMEATGNRPLPFIPAYPELKRVTRKGFQYLDGKPIHESTMAKDPLNPINESFIPAIIGSQSDIPVRLIPLNGTIPVTHDSKEILVFDAEKPEHLKKIANDLQEKKLLAISAGCAGFAHALMEVLPLNKNLTKTKNEIENLPILIISGSLHPVSINQVKAALEKNIPGFSMAGEKTAIPGWLESTEAETLAASVSQALNEKRICVLGTDAAFGNKVVKFDHEENIPLISNNIANTLGKITSKIIEKTGSLHLVVFGGDSLLGIINSLNYNYLVPHTEILPGIVVSSAGQENGLLITKAGAFGDNDVIQKITDYINKGGSCS